MNRINVFRVRSKRTKRYISNASNGRTFWTRRADAERIADRHGDAEVVMFGLYEVAAYE